MSDFLAGVIEGFYGPPWSEAERLELLGWMQADGLDTYVYAPKDDLHHRILWRTPYAPPEAAALARLVAAARAHGVRFIYALGPGLDLRFSSAADAAALRARCDQLLDLGCRDFALLFDDIPDRVDPADVAPWGSFAAAHAAAANALFAHVRARARAPAARFLFCPTPYCGRMADRGLGGPGYLAVIGAALDPAIDICWTGPEIISAEITPDHLAPLAATLRRPPILWDNLFANDYDGRRFFCGPAAGRPPALRPAVRGHLVNPNTEHPLNFAPLRSFAASLRAAPDAPFDPRAAHLAALRQWWPRFAPAAGAPLDWDDFVLFCDCFYLPHADGPAADELAAAVAAALAAPPAPPALRTRVVRLRDFCARLAELRDRPLFHALSRRVWELREELDLLDRALAAGGTPFASDFHLPGTYRGGFVPRLQRLLVPRADGTFVPAPPPAP